jgi:PAS domain S-box-containing protein
MADQGELKGDPRLDERHVLRQRIAELEISQAQYEQAQKALRQRNRELEWLNRANRAFSSSLELDQVLTTVLEEARHLLDVISCSIWLIEPETEELICWQAADPYSDIMRGWRLAPGQGIAGWVARSGRSTIVPDTRTDARHYKGVDQRTGLEHRSILTVPLQVKEVVIGVIQVADTAPNRFNAGDQGLFESLAGAAAIAIENARLYQETARLGAFNENIVQSMEEAVLLQDAAGHITFVNPKGVALLGYTADELIGQQWKILLTSEQAAYVENQRNEWAQDIASRYETTLLTKAGTRIPIIASARPLFENDRFSGVLSVLTDIAERAQAEQALRESERKNRALLDAIPDLMLRLSKDGVYLEVIPAKHFDAIAPPNQLLGKSVLEVLPDDVARQQMGAVQQALQASQIQVYEYQLETQGELRDFEARVVASGEDEALAIIRDVTRRKQIEAAIHRYAGRLKTLHEIDLAILSAQSPQATARAALSHIRRLVPCRRASVTEFDRKTHTARVLATHLDGETQIKTGALMPPEAFQDELLSQGQIVIGDIMALPHPSAMHQALLRENVRAYLSVPLIAEGELIGSLNLGSDRPGVFEDQHVDVAREAANSLAVAIRHARLYEQTRQDAETKAILLQEVNHRVKNNLSAIIGLLYTEKRRERVDDQATYQAIMQDLINRIQGLATVHQLLSHSEWAPLPLGELTSHVIHSVLRGIPSDRHMTVEVSPSPVRVTAAQATSLALIVNELATNAVKYAWSASRTTRLSVLISAQDDTVHFEFRDNGPGYPQEVLGLERHNVGLYLVQTLVCDDLRGELSLTNDQGAVTTIRFKPSQPTSSRVGQGRLS